MERLISFAGYFVLIALAWVLSSDRRQFPWRVVILTTGLQFAIAWPMLNTETGEQVARNAIWLGLHYYALIDRGAVAFVGESYHELPLLLQVVPSTLFIAATSSLLYHFHILQFVVRWLASLIQRSFGVSGVESLVVGSSALLGRIETLFLIRPFLSGLTKSELHTVLVCGFATVSLSTLAAIARLGFSQTHLVTAALISAPAGLLMAKVLMPETQIPATLGRLDYSPISTAANSVEAIVQGTFDGLKVVVRVVAVAIVFFAILAIVDRALVQLGMYFGYPSRLPGEGWSLRNVLKYVLIPFAWIIGIAPKDCLPASELLGLRFLATEITAYDQLSEWVRPGATTPLDYRTQVLLTYALCGFSNFITIGLQVAAVGTLAPERRAEASRLVVRALIGGTLACFMTACVAGVLV